MDQQQQEMSSNQTTAGEGTELQLTAAELNKRALKALPWRSYQGDLIIVDSESSSSDDDTKNMEDLTLSTPPIIVKSKPNISLEAIPISPGILDLSLPNDSTPISPGILDLSLLNDSTPNYK